MSWGRIVRPGGDNPARPLGSGLAGRIVRPMCAGRSAFITTRCYSPSGVQIWDGDHGSTVFAIAVGNDGTIYQSGKTGAESLLGPSLFHDVAGLAPLITGMRPGGYPLWSIKQSPYASQYSSGIATDSVGHVYYGYNDESVSPFRSYIAKINSNSGEFIERLPTLDFFGDGENTLPEGIGRVRCDNDGSVYAILEAMQGVGKWKNGVEFWVVRHPDYLAFNATGLGVSGDGRAFIASSQVVSGLPVVFDGFYGFETDTGNISPHSAPPYFFVYTATESIPLLASIGCKQGGCSPNGNHWIAFNAFNNDIVGTKTVGTSGPGGSVFFRYTATAINDAGIYCYSANSGVTGYTHIIRAADNSLIAQHNHGGEIYDAVVLPDGSVIVAGARVAR